MSLKTLQQQWYKKLKDKGFNDIESNEINLKRNSSYFKEEYSIDNFKAKERYYQLAGQLTYSHPWKNIRDKQVWAYHAEGKTDKEVADLTQVSLITVKRIIAKYKEFICLKR